MKPSRAVAAFLLIALVLTADASAQKKSRAEIADDIELMQAQLDHLVARLREKEQELLAPSAEDKKAHADFLAQPDTGLVRLLPRGRYDLALNGGGAYYSFKRRTNEYGHGSDIELEDERFKVGFAGADFGLLVSLGEVALESVSAEAAELRPLAEIAAPADVAKARELYFRSSFGVEEQGRVYKREVPALVNHTYAVRSVVYGESDVLVAFRVVRKDGDGSLVLLWKMLTEFPRPALLKLERESAEQ